MLPLSLVHGDLREIRRRIRSVKNTQQLTKAMKTVSAAKLRRAQERVLSARPYAGSWNDGSRLAAVESLVDYHTWAIDDSIFVRNGRSHRVALCRPSSFTPTVRTRKGPLRYTGLPSSEEPPCRATHSGVVRASAGGA